MYYHIIQMKTEFMYTISMAKQKIVYTCIGDIYFFPNITLTIPWNQF